MAFSIDNRAHLPLFQHDNLLRYNDQIAHGISTKHLPLAKSPLAAYVRQPDSDGNPAPDDFRVGARGMTEEMVARRRAVLVAAIGLDPATAAANITGGRQTHGNGVARVGVEFKGQARNWTNALPDIDGLVTNTPDLPLLTVHADCPAITIYDPVRRAVGLAHSGRRGTLLGIGAVLVATLNHSFDSDPKDMIAAISPSIGPCCYEVGEDVVAEVRQVWGDAGDDVLVPHGSDGRVAFDLWAANRGILQAAGIPRANIENAGICTKHHSDTFFSYRAQGGAGYGNFGAMIALRP